MNQYTYDGLKMMETWLRRINSERRSLMRRAYISKTCVDSGDGTHEDKGT